MVDLPFDPRDPFSDDDIRRIEHCLGREVHPDYAAFAKRYGACFVGGSARAINGDVVSLLCFFGRGNSGASVLMELAAHPDLRDEGILPIARCELGNLFVLDRDGTVHYIDYCGGMTKAIKVAESFRDFTDRITVDVDE